MPTIALHVRRIGTGIPNVAKQLRYATSLAINRTLEEAQATERAGLRARFTLRSARSERFLGNLIHFAKADRATKQHLRGVMGVQEPFGKSFKGKAGLLAKFEAGGVKRGFQGQAVAIPSENIRPHFADVVPRSLYPTNLGLTSRRAISGGTTPARARQGSRGGVLLQGKRRTFAVDWNYQGAGKTLYGVFQRVGRGKESDTRLLWVYKRQVPIPARLGFVEGATRTVARRFAPNMQGFLSLAIRTAR